MEGSFVIEFHLDSRSGVSPYMQIVQQVRHALRLGLLREGDQLPTVKEVVARLAINPNTVLKAYRELEHAGLVAARPGVGTFVTGSARRSRDRRARAVAPRAARLDRQGAPRGPRRGVDRGAVSRRCSLRPHRGGSVSVALATRGLGKRYGRRWALSGCTLEVPAGHVAGLVGPNGAGKTTLLHLAVGLIEPSAGSIAVLGEEVAATPAQLARVGFVAQETPLYPSLSVADHLRLGAALNPGWDAALAQARIARLGLDRAQRAGTLSGGQRAQLALTLAIAKRPELLVLDEPVASLDPLARREFLQGLMEFTAEHTVSVVLSSHLVADLERVCDYLILVAEGRVQLSGEVDELLATHRRLSGPRRDSARLPASQQVIEETHTDRQSTLLVRTEEPIIDPAWSVEEVSLEDIVLAYMGRPAADAAPARIGR